jgi:HIV Tat-specific factor 1
LADWSDEDTSKQVHGRWAKVVILRYMFTLEELEEDPAALIELKEDVREECEKIGEVTNVVLFDAEKDGIMSVRFADEEDALECVRVGPRKVVVDGQVMNGRYFSGRKIEADTYDGKARYKKAKGGTAGDDGGDEVTRLEKFGAWLEDGNDA